MKILVVGAGFAGSSIARTLAESGHSVTLIDKRDHIGGNAFDFINQYGERIHRYGPHLLHGDINSVAIKWLSRFTEWIPYEHRVLAQLESGSFVPLPVNRTTLEAIFNTKLHSDEGAEVLLRELRADIPHIKTADDVFMASVGQRLSDIFFRPYTKKMWGLDSSEIEADVGKRIPVRTNRDDRYFTDSFQALPKDGYARLFESILDHKNISIHIGRSFDYSDLDSHDHSFLSMPIDFFFNYKYGRLPYRSIKFQNKQSKVAQPCVTVNFTDQSIFTRSTQWDLLPNSLRSRSGFSTQTLEIPCRPEDNNNECYYPVRNQASINCYDKYQKDARSIPCLSFCGRAGLFRYLDMVPAINIHLKMANQFLSS